eukprot:s726_g21.t1
MSDEAVDERFFLFEVDSVQIVVPGLQRGISCMKLDGVHRSMRTLTATAAVCQPKPPASDSQPAEPADPLEPDSQPVDPGLSESLPAEDNQDPDVQNLFEADEEMQAPEGSKPDEEDVLFAPKRKLYSCSLTMFFVILLWDVLGTPRPNANVVRSFYEWKPQQPFIVNHFKFVS